MKEVRNPHEIALGESFPSLPQEMREEMRSFLDDYCEIALQIYERIERERMEQIDEPHSNSYSEGKVDSPKK